MGGVAVWITGLPGSGKSMLADALKRVRKDFSILRMDDLRRIVTPRPSYSDEEREIVYRSLVYLAKELSDAGLNVVIDATGNMRRWRELARAVIPKYIEVYLRCPLEECMEREKSRKDSLGAPRDIYEKGKSGSPVPGLSAPYEEPLNPELTIHPGTSADDGAGLIIGLLKERQLLQTTDQKGS